MKTLNLLSILATSILLVGCIEKEPSSSSIDSSSTISSSSIKESTSSTISSSSTSSQSSSSSSTEEGIKQETIFNSNNQCYLYDYVSIKDFYDTEKYDFIGFYKPDSTFFEVSEDCFRLIKEGETSIKVLFYDLDWNEVYDYFNVSIVPFHFNSENLSNKTITIFGDSISDSSTTAYSPAPKFWDAMLIEKYNVTVHNYAVSGSSLSYSQGFRDNNSAFSSRYIGTSIWGNVSKNHIKESDYTFIYYGNNDYTYGCRIGNYGEVDESNIMSKESFKGAYSYLIDCIRNVNPYTRIIVIGLSTSSWSMAGNIKNDEHALTRSDLNDVCKDIAFDLHCKYVNVYGLWPSGASEYCGDGIHPLTPGYEKIVEQIEKS